MRPLGLQPQQLPRGSERVATIVCPPQKAPASYAACCGSSRGVAGHHKHGLLPTSRGHSHRRGLLARAGGRPGRCGAPLCSMDAAHSGFSSSRAAGEEGSASSTTGGAEATTLPTFLYALYKFSRWVRPPAGCGRALRTTCSTSICAVHCMCVTSPCTPLYVTDHPHKHPAYLCTPRCATLYAIVLLCHPAHVPLHPVQVQQVGASCRTALSVCAGACARAGVCGARSTMGVRYIVFTAQGLRKCARAGVCGARSTRLYCGIWGRS